MFLSTVLLTRLICPFASCRRRVIAPGSQRNVRRLNTTAILTPKLTAVPSARHGDAYDHLPKAEMWGKYGAMFHRGELRVSAAAAGPRR